VRRAIRIETDSRRLLALAISVLLIVGACDSGATPASSPSASVTPGAGSSVTAAPQPPDAAAELECERERYPCTPAEVDAAVAELEGGYADEISDMLDAGGGYADALAWIRQQEGVVAADADDSELFFRLDGGQPMYVSEIPEGEPAWESDVALERAIALTSHSVVADIAAAPPESVVGEETLRDDRQNLKRALFLEPLHPDKNAGFDLVLDQLRQIPDYDHPPAIDRRQGRAVTPDAFRGWQDYDAIFVATHGGTIGGSWLLSGIYDRRDRTLSRPEQCEALLSDWSQTHTRCVAVKHNNRWFLGIAVRGDFFSATYGSGGLEQAIVYIGGCNGLNMPDISTALAGSSSAYVSWNETTVSPQWEAAGVYLIEALARRWTVEQSLAHVCGSEFGCTVATTGAVLGIHDNGAEPRELRIHDVPTLLHPDGAANVPPVGAARLEDGARLEIRGIAGDGEKDALEITVYMAGVIDPGDPQTAPLEAANLYEMRFFVDAHEVGRDNLGQPRHPSGQVEHLGGSTFRYSFIAELPFDDIDPAGTDTSLNVVVDLPEGGTSDYEADVTLVGSEGCTFRALFIGGLEADIFARTTAYADLPADFLVHGTADAVLSQDGTALTGFQFDGPDQGLSLSMFASPWFPVGDDRTAIPLHSTGSFQMTGSGAVWDIQFNILDEVPSFADGEPLLEYFAGPAWWDPEWAPLDLFISEFTDERVVGTIAGEVRSIETNMPSQLHVEFQARTKVGSSSLTECGSLGF
jgi:hypothetical protein